MLLSSNFATIIARTRTSSGRRLRDVEISKSRICSGFFGATIFGAAVLGWQSSYAPTEIEKQECREAAKKAGHKTEECKSIWEKTTTEPVALFTFVLSLSTIGLWVATGTGILIQTRDTRILQRAYLSVERRGIDVTTRNQIVGQIAIVNNGRLPAKKISLFVKFTWDAHGDLRDSDFAPIPASENILPVGTDMLSGTTPLLPIEQQHFEARNGYVYIWGRITPTKTDSSPRGNCVFVIGTIAVALEMKRVEFPNNMGGIIRPGRR
jgi:hypothetical protein